VKGKPKYSEGVVSKFKKCVLILKNVENSMELSNFRGLNFEALKGDKKGLFSIRVD
jgi:proteic killer suppression protein